MKTLYLDIFSGISGDMFLGAMIDLGVRASRLEEELKKLHLQGYEIAVLRGHKSQIHGVKFEVQLKHEHEHKHDHDHDHGHTHHHGHQHEHHHEDDHTPEHHDHEGHGRTYAEIKELISRSGLSDWVKARAASVFERIAVAEGKIHGLALDEVHFHEVGAVDSIVDIVGACIALEELGKPCVLAAPVVEGMGWIDCAHGRFPIPAPATLEILGARGIGITQCEEPHELVTPTGAALLAEFVERFGGMQGLVAEKVGFGLGTRDNKTRPNVLRAILGKSASVKERAGGNDWETDTIAVLETNLDDINAEILGHFVEQALAEGALDVFHTPIQMKKNRPGVLLTVLCATLDADKFTELMLRETSAFGVRRHETARRKLQRELVKVKTQHGVVTVKVGRLNGKMVQVAPEFESCKKLADASNTPLKAIYEAAQKAFGAEATTRKRARK